MGKKVYLPTQALPPVRTAPKATEVQEEHAHSAWQGWGQCQPTAQLHP